MLSSACCCFLNRESVLHSNLYLLYWHHSPHFFSKLYGVDLKSMWGRGEEKILTVIEGLCVIVDICRTFLSSCIHYAVNYSLFST